MTGVLIRRGKLRHRCVQRERNVKTQAWREDGHMKTVTGIGVSGHKLRNGGYQKLKRQGRLSP